MTDVHVPYYLDYLPRVLLTELTAQAEEVAAVPGLRVAQGLRSAFPELESDDALAFVCAVYEKNMPQFLIFLDEPP